MRRPAQLLIAATIAFLVMAKAGTSQQITIDGVARSASEFNALATFCADLLPIDIGRVKNYEQVFIEAGAKSFGRARFNDLLRKEFGRRRQEVEITGRNQWCMYQRAHLEKMGVDFFKDR
jgi:hypothetical protein